jgi:hypothetical protein
VIPSTLVPARDARRPVPHGRPSPAALRFRRKFERFFPNGFQDQAYLERERRRKWKAHERWSEQLDPATCRSLLKAGRYADIAGRAVGIGAWTGLLSPIEKGALREAVRTPEGARLFAIGLHEFVHAPPNAETFESWSGVLESLSWKVPTFPTWPIATVFGFIARPDRHIVLKPVVFRVAAREYGFDSCYQSRPNSQTYLSLQRFAAEMLLDVRDLNPSDMIDIQSFIWVQGSSEYEE